MTSNQINLLTEAGGFMKSRVMLTAAELDLFTKLHDAAVPAVELAEACGLDVRALRRLLDSLVAFGLLESRDGRYRNTEKGALLSSRHPETLLPMLLHLNGIWGNWSRLSDCIEKGHNPSLNAVVGSGDENQTRAFIGAMHVIGRDLSREIAGAYDAGGRRNLLDVGGGSGTYTIAFLEANPQMEAAVFDFAEVLPMAEQRLAGAGVRGRIRLVAGDFYKDTLPDGFDLVLLSAVIHQNDPEENLSLYRKCARALEPGGALLIRDHIMDVSRTRPPAGAVFALNMLVNTRGGDTYTFEELKADLEAAGFQDVKLLRSGERMDCLVEAVKPG